MTMIRGLALVCCLLTGAIAAELSYRPGGDSQTSVLAAASRPEKPQASERSAGDKDLRERWLATVMARPLFAPDRRPVAGTSAADPNMPRLTGIITSPGGSVAIFQPEGHGKAVVTRHGDTVGGWEITAVAANAVDLQKAGDRIVLMPRFDNSQTGATANVEAKQTQSRWEAAAPVGLLRARWSNPQLQP